MGRRKVDPSQRRRAVRACTQCKQSKKRCDEALPCTNCTRRGFSGLCTFEDSDPPQSQPQPAAPLSDPTGASASPATPHNTQSRLLSNAQGQRVYIGPSASLSFLQLVRDTVAKSIGPSEFSEHAKRDQMLEAELGQTSDCVTDIEIAWAQKLGYAHSFLAATRGFLGFLSEQDAISMIQTYPACTREGASYRCSVACLIVAIGAQCSKEDPSDAEPGRRAFSFGQKAAFSGRLEDPSLEMIQSFLLLAFYMLGACKRNAAFMYLGIAARAAFALGLHSSDYYRLMPRELRESSLNLWRSLVNLDLITSSILGRTAATSVSKSRDGEPTMSGMDASPETLALQSSFHLSLLVDEIVSTFYKPHGTSIDVAERYLALLNKWSQNLPAQLRITTMPQGSEEHTRVQVVGSLHLSCYYYFAVMLVSRPFLISYLVAGVDRSRAGYSDATFTNGSTSVADMAQTCLRAAVLMAQTCAEVDEAGSMMENMCIVKAWVFTAGLVLGFHMFTTDKADLEVDGAFLGARNVLQKLSIRSLQAAHYADILKHLANAITQQRRLRTSSSQDRACNIVDKILNLRSTSDNLQSTWPDENEVGSASFDLDGTFPIDNSTQSLAFNSYQGPPVDFDAASFGYDSAILQFWDHFLFDGGGFPSNDLQFG